MSTVTLEDRGRLWEATLGELELTLSKANFTTWFRNTFVITVERDEVVVGVPNGFTKTWLENKYHQAILKALQRITNNSVQHVSYRVETSRAVGDRAPVAAAVARVVAETNGNGAPVNEFGLNPRYTLATFITGKGNELAHAAALAVSQKPGVVYNPLFIYGGVGLGKTHLMQAIGHETLKRFPDKNVVYVTSERFTNEFIQAISRGSGEEFKRRYRSADVLLIDDVQFLAGKEQTQVEFFHTFNALHHLNKQIVLTSDRPPKAIPALEARLVSRFEWGMIADIQEPDLETRIAILKAKLKEKDFALEDVILSYLASTIQSNVRELEGALNRIIAYHQLNRTPLTLEGVKALLGTVTRAAVEKRGRALSPKQVLSAVSAFYDISIEDLTGSSRKKELVGARQIVMFLLREDVGSSYPTIGHELGGRDHTTAIHAYEKIRRQVENNEKVRNDITLIRQRLFA